MQKESNSLYKIRERKKFLPLFFTRAKDREGKYQSQKLLILSSALVFSCMPHPLQNGL